MKTHLYYSLGQIELYVGFEKQDIAQLETGKKLEGTIGTPVLDISDVFENDYFKMKESGIEFRIFLNVQDLVNISEDNETFEISIGEKSFEKIKKLNQISSHKDILDNYENAVHFNWETGYEILFYIVKQN